MPRRIAINDLRKLAKLRGMTHVIVFATDEKGTQHVATFGRTIVEAGQAADFGNKMKKHLGWPVDLAAQPSRVRRLQETLHNLTLRPTWRLICPSCGADADMPDTVPSTKFKCSGQGCKYIGLPELFRIKT